MLRLRTTFGLSLLALILGVAGTAWLSTLTDTWAGPPGHAEAHASKVRTLLRRHPRGARVVDAADTSAPAASATRPEPVPELTPLEMPSLSAGLWTREVWREGKVELSLRVDGTGRVQQASVAHSSGDAGLDARAVRTVLGWRFAVPADHPEGLSGRLVMRFEDSAASL
jgi:protein TonB